MSRCDHIKKIARLYHILFFYSLNCKEVTIFKEILNPSGICVCVREREKDTLEKNIALLLRSSNVQIGKEIIRVSSLPTGNFSY